MTIEARNITKQFGTFAALRDVNLTVPSGELVALLGPSGSGKTTLLRIIAGLEQPDAGRRLAPKSPPQARRVLCMPGRMTSKLPETPTATTGSRPPCCASTPSVRSCALSCWAKTTARSAKPSSPARTIAGLRLIVGEAVVFRPRHAVVYAETANAAPQIR